MSEARIPEFDTAFTFVRRPSSLPPDLRPMWKISLLMLVLHLCCRGGRSSLQRLHVLNWAVRNPESREGFNHVIEGRGEPTDIVVRYEPGLQRAIDLALGQKLILRVGGDRVQLSSTGRAFAKTLLAEDCLSVEKAFFQGIKRSVTEARVEQIVYMVST